ncbi:MAG: preprotein translocase subunit SecA [Candidatus Omnitrophica bacterium]|nr:preprotein translocase subunit SecA [Candidatus Omnitrophota bacterium]MBD3269123.1 preprotein translocase subunit SecA [Candidatus Omnitrophota bacterium]
MPTPSLREVSVLAPVVNKVNSLEKEISEKEDSFFPHKTNEYRKMIKDKTASLEGDACRQALENILDEILPYYFSMVREAARRTVKMRHFDVQILGGIVLHKNKIAEMVTGEGKTLVATLAASLNALAGRGVHIVTVNDYLAKRDREWMGPVYEFMGLSCGVIQQNMDKEERKRAYSCDITYGTNNEFGFDYLRDNMVGDPGLMVQPGHFYAIVDEVDSILIDEARTPLIISGPAESYIDKYYLADRAIRQIKVKVIIQSFDNKEGTITIKNLDGSEAVIDPSELENNYDAVVEEKTHNAYFTPRGEKRCEKLLGVESITDEAPDKLSNPWLHYLTQSLRAHKLFKNEREYIIKEGKVVIVDEFTGRLMPGRRWSDGLHQAVEAKENLKIQEESQTLATITLQNYFRMYDKLAGMTGTAYTEANEFKHIYRLDVVAVPTNRPLIRTNYPDRIYKTKKGKFNAVIEEIAELHKEQRPMLVGTTSIEDSEVLSFLLSKKGIEHNVLNAKYHEREAYVVAQAGRLGQVTIATNMAGRGTDIILGGNLDYFIKDILNKNGISPEDENYPEDYNKLYPRYKGKFEEEHNAVVRKGGLHIIGTQRHEARRIDNQLRGRSGRQGDPGSSRFYVSLEDDLMRLFGSERIYNLMDSLGFPEDQPIEHGLINHSLAVAQKRVEGHNFEIRKQLLQYDNIMNKQREVIYKQRKEILESGSLTEEILSMAEEVIDKNVSLYFQEEIDTFGLTHWLKSKFNLDKKSSDFDGLSLQETVKLVKKEIEDLYRNRLEESGPENMHYLEKTISLWVVDSRWKEHLLILDHLREGIHLRSHAHVDPLVEYQKESYYAFQDMIYSIKEGIVDMAFKARLKPREPSPDFDIPQNFIHARYSPLRKKGDESKEAAAPRATDKKVGRNDPCPCGSGKKYKKCCGR